jgi:hypothetical protein
VGNYAINQGTLFLSSNYLLSYGAGTFSITPAVPFSASGIVAAGGQVILTFTGTSAVTYVTESAASLAGPWQPVSTNTPGPSGIWSVTNNASGTQQFFRAFIP